MYKNYTYKTCLLFPIVLYIIIIYYVLCKNLKNSKLTIFLILATLIYIISMRYYRNKFIEINNIDKKDLDNEECLLGKCKSYKGILNKGCLDLWHVYHMLFWLLFGMLYPNKYIMVLFISILWESLEGVYADCFRLEDIFINVASYIIGSYISNNIVI